MVAYEKRLEQVFDKLDITEEDRDSLKARLAGVKERDVLTYKHSIRAGLKGVEVADFVHLDSKPLLYSGLLHDIGKECTDPDSLKKTEGFNGKDMEELKKHSLRGYEMVRGVRDFVAEIILRVHRYGEDPYPKQFPKPKREFSNSEIVMIGYYSRLLSLIDYYDSSIYRKDNKFTAGEVKKLNKKEAKEKILEHNPGQEYLIEALYTAKIFK